MNQAVVLFLEKVNQVRLLVVRIGTATYTAGTPDHLGPGQSPPFTSDKFLVQKLSRLGEVVSPVRKLLSGCKSPLLHELVSHRRQVYMIYDNKVWGGRE